MDRYRHPLLNILFGAVLALAASALMLFAIFVMSIESSIPEGADRQLPIEILGKNMQVAVGTAEVRGARLAITEYHPRGGELTAVAVWRGRFEAAEYPLLRYQVDTVFRSPVLKLIWRLSSNTGGFYTIDLRATNNGSSWLNLAQYPIWQGTVEEIGIFATTSSAEQELTVSHLTLEPLGWRAALATHWSDWTTFRGWSVGSINFLYGTADPNALSPTLVAAAWSALAVSLLLIARLFVGGVPSGALAAALLLPWVALDLLWQKELMSQLNQTREQFAGKTVHEKHLADVDGTVYGYIKRLKDEVLPAEFSRIAILHDSHGHNFWRLKAQYYLLPNNVYNFGSTPPLSGVDNIDYIIVFGEVPGLEFRLGTNTLVWDQGKMTLAVELLDSDPVGNLYRVLRRPSGEDEKL